MCVQSDELHARITAEPQAYRQTQQRKIEVSDDYSPLRGFDPSKHTGDDYMAMHRNAGHVCCSCPNQKPPLPCCNPGHAESVKQADEFRRITSVPDDMGKTTADRCVRCQHTRYVHIPDGGCDFDAHYEADECPCDGFVE